MEPSWELRNSSEITVLERQIDEFKQVVYQRRVQGIDFIKDMLSLSLKLYAVLNKFSYIVVNKLANAANISPSEGRFSGLSELLTFIMGLLTSINFSTVHSHSQVENIKQSSYIWITLMSSVDASWRVLNSWNQLMLLQSLGDSSVHY